MDALELAKKARKQNIIDMAVVFSAMMPLFQECSAALIKEKLADLFEGLHRINSDQDFGNMHTDFCQWFVKTIRLAKTEEPSSYGHAAVHCFHCGWRCGPMPVPGGFCPSRKAR